MNKPGKTLTQLAYAEFKEFVVIALYLWLVLGLFVLYKSVLLNEEHVSILTKGFAIINALVLGKVILVARALHLGDRYNNLPLIYPTLLKSALFSVVLAVFKILEAVAVSLYYKQSFQQSISDFGNGTLAGILTLTALMFILLVPFFGFTELQRVIGEEKLKRVFLGPRELESQSQN